MDTITYNRLYRSVIYLTVCKKTPPQTKPLNDESSRQLIRVRVK